ncbi:bifunctional diguanylate cyclase/phosphodiesterase [Methylococcus sp. EFPC2]|uniref:putative bifunctional diguanylate cyclase/phosphodiesterase n=1 Tax=Methylococcus sp. EFPC2 TaxID=2812648 RepID=UPI0019683E96|nr:EAL domain-containing protein [Methylococcus sp. EFPC2]QSA98242.1 EAL domain-containing protein [Methylococcus sp. EFPC2]
MSIPRIQRAPSPRDSACLTPSARTLCDVGKEHSVGQILQYVRPIRYDENCLKVLDRFLHDDELYATAVIDSWMKPVGLIERGRLIELFVRPYTRDLHRRKPIDQLMDTAPVIVDIDTAIDDLARIILDAGMRHMENGFIIIEDGRYVGMGTGRALLQQITERKQKKLFHLAHYDQLTGLANRLLFDDRLRQACQRAERQQTSAALLFVDLDRFKYVNDTLGHAIGDSLLRAVGHRLMSYVRESDTVARLGGDEFVIIIERIRDIADTAKLCESIAAGLGQPFIIQDHEIRIGASIGVAVFPQHDPTPEGLVRNADAAMYEAKQNGRGRHVVYSENLSRAVLERLSLESELRHAMERTELSLFYQPQIQITDGRIVGVEALMRWRHPTLGSVSPAKFIPVAEETGLIVPLGTWALREACKQHRAWLEQGLPPIRVAINISALQFRQKQFFDHVKAVIEETGIDPQYIELELTESMVMKDAEHTVSALAELRTLGVKLAIDDFGTGYSSLSYLRKFPLDRIKIDQSFIRDMREIPANQAIVRAIIALCDSLGIETIAEGVETEGDLACLKCYACEEAQGYHFARPMPAADFEAWYKGRAEPIPPSEPWRLDVQETACPEACCCHGE